MWLPEKRPHRALETRSTFAPVACLPTPNPSCRIVLQAPPNRACEGGRDVATASTLLLALENCLHAGQGGGGGGVGEVWVENVVVRYFAFMWVSGEWVFDTTSERG